MYVITAQQIIKIVHWKEQMMCGTYTNRCLKSSHKIQMFCLFSSIIKWKNTQASYPVKKNQGYRTRSFVRVPYGLHLSRVAPMEAVKAARSTVYNGKSRMGNA